MNDFQSHSLEASWDIDGGWNVGARAYFTDSESEYVFERYQARFEQAGGLVSYDQSGVGQVPSVAFSGVNLSPILLIAADSTDGKIFDAPLVRND